MKVNTTFSFHSWVCELEQSKFNGSVTVEETVQVKHVVSTMVVMSRPEINIVSFAIPLIPAVFQFPHCLWIALVHQLKEVSINHFAVLSESAIIDADCPYKLTFMRCHHIHQIFDVFHSKTIFPTNMNMDTASY